MMGNGWQRLRMAWKTGTATPQLVLGWMALIGVWGALRWVGSLPGNVAFSALGLLAIVVAGWQSGELGRALMGRRQRPQWTKRYLFSWGSCLLGGVILWLPWGLGGLSSRVLVRLRLPAGWINWVSLYRRPVLAGAALVYLLLIIWGVIWGPQHLTLTTSDHRGTPLQMVMGLLVTSGLFAGWLGGILVITWLTKLITPRVSAPVAVGVTSLALALVLMGVTLAAILGLTTLVWSWCGQPSPSVSPAGASGPTWVAVIGCWLLVAGGVVTQTMRQPQRFGATTLISHRGVDHQRGVQNTLGALRRVHAERPGYVEMDLHETKDGQWIVLHDENLGQLAQRNVTPHQLTLRQLERLRVHENGQSDRLVGWPEYLRTAEKLRQPLLVEIKTTPQDSPGMLQRFARRYGPRLVRDHSAVHSLDYRAVTGLKRVTPALRVGYITPFNWVAPQSVPADFYSLQRLSVSDQFVQAAHRMRAPAYLWTPDSRATMTRLWALGADGQITNELLRLRSVVAQRPQDAWWAVVLNFSFSYI